MHAIEPLITAKLSELKETIGLRRAGKNAEALVIVNAGSGKAFMDEIRTRMAALDRTAQARDTEFTAIADRNSSRLRIVGTREAVCSSVFWSFRQSRSRMA